MFAPSPSQLILTKSSSTAIRMTSDSAPIKTLRYLKNILQKISDPNLLLHSQEFLCSLVGVNQSLVFGFYFYL